MNSIDPPDDHELLRLIAKRDQQALRVLYERHGAAAFDLASYILRSRPLAEEVVQDVFVLVWNHPTKWKADRGLFSSWLLAVTRYTAIDRLRRESRHNHTSAVPLDELIERADVVGSETQIDDLHLIRLFLNELPDDQKQVLFLAFFQQLTHEDIARQLKIPHGTVKSRLRLALEKLRARWREEAAEPPKHRP